MRHRSLAQGITVFVAVAMPLFVSLVGLALDAGHLYAVHTDLQAVADAAARAGAAQLNTTGGGALRSESGNPPQLDPAAAEAAATAYAVYQGVEPVSVVADVQQVAVQVGQTVPMVFLRVLHINSRWIEARGVAHPRAGVTTGE
jgi:Flp pilus assembly protein TadG